MSEPFDYKSYWETRLKQHYDISGVGWMKLGKAYNNWTYYTKKRVVQRAIRKVSLDLASCHVLDVGSGTGFMIDCWAGWGAKAITGSDLTEVAVTHLRSRYPQHRIEQVDICQISALDVVGKNGYDVVSCFDVLYHVVDDACLARALSNISAALRPGGYFFLTDYFLHRASPIQTSHVALRLLAQYQPLLRSEGFEIESCVPIYFLSYPPLDWPKAIFTYPWYALTSPMRIAPFLGHVYGPILSPIDLLLGRFINRFPGLKLMVCRKSQ